MIYNLLADLPEGGQRINVGEALIYGVIGYLVVFLGIAVLVGIVSLVGKLMQKKTGKAPQKAAPKAKPAPTVQAKSETPKVSVSDDGISEETIAVITAAIAAYYEKQNRTCGFTVRRIKRM